jgi:hypothetical protein
VRAEPAAILSADRLQLALGAAGLATCSVAVSAAVRAVHVRPQAGHRLDVGGVGLSYPAVDAAAAALLVLALLGAAALAAALRAVVAQLLGHRRLVRELPVAGTLPSEPDVHIVESTAPIAFCAGWLRPRIYISSAALSRLSRAELDAVLTHERRHRAARDPLRLAAGRVLSEALFFLPVLRPLQDRAGNVAELRADATALAANRGKPGPLASAMLVLGSSPSGDTVGIAPERVDALLGAPSTWRPPWLLLLAALITLGSVATVLWRAVGAASIEASLALPILAARPCVVVLAAIPVVGALAHALARRPLRG